MKKQWIWAVLVMAMVMMTACGSPKHPVILEEVIFEDGVEIWVYGEMKSIVIEYLKSQGIEGDFESGLKCFQVEDDHEDIDLVHLMLENTAIDILVIVSNNDIVSMVERTYYSKLYRTDLNDDGVTELLVQSTFGSGILSHKFVVYDLKTLTESDLGFYNNNEDAVLVKEEDGVYVHTYYSGFDKVAEAPLGKLILDHKGLIIEGYEDDF